VGPSTNFGIGLIAATDTANVIEDNTIVGNTNGIYLAAGVQGNIFRGNLIVGNPPVQVGIDQSPTGGSDILNMANAGANAFEGNICLTSVNAPCAFIGPSLTANPNPIPVSGNVLGSTTISWNAPDAQVIEVHIGSPTGPLFTMAGNHGSVQTGPWVSDGMTFFLQDVTGAQPLTSDHTLATLVVHLQGAGHALLRRRPLLLVAGVSSIPLLGLVVCGFYWRRRPSLG
jgi:parallel beta-helix repeat protein